MVNPPLPHPVILKFSSNKHIFIHFDEELQTPCQYTTSRIIFNQHSGGAPRKVLRDFASKKVKPRSLQWEPGAVLMDHYVLEPGRPMLVLFKCYLITLISVLMKLSVQSVSTINFHPKVSTWTS